MGYVQAKIMVNGKPCEVGNLTTEGLHEAAERLHQLAVECEVLLADKEDEEEVTPPENRVDCADCRNHISGQSTGCICDIGADAHKTCCEELMGSDHLGDAEEICPDFASDDEDPE